MIGDNWNNEQKRRLRAMRIDPVRSPPKRLKTMIDYFGTPGVFLYDVTEGDEPFHVSKSLGTKIRNFVADGALDWVLGEDVTKHDQGVDVEWQSWLMSHAAQFSEAVDIYKQDLGVQIQTAEIHQGLRATFMPPRLPYGPLQRPFIEAVFRSDSELEYLRREFESALKTKSLVGARELSEKIELRLLDRIAI